MLLGYTQISKLLKNTAISKIFGTNYFLPAVVGKQARIKGQSDRSDICGTISKWFF